MLSTVSGIKCLQNMVIFSWISSKYLKLFPRPHGHVWDKKWESKL